MNAEAVVRTANLTVRRGRTVVLRDVSVELECGVVTVVGPNAAGKSTLLGTLATLVPIGSGVAEVAGHNLTTERGAREARKKIGFLPQEPAFLSGFTVNEAVSYAAWLHLVPRDRRSAAVGRTLEELDLTGVGDHRLTRLSGGTRRRAYIAQALVHEPPVLLLDEPTVGIDTEHRVDLRRLIRRLASGRLVLVSTHLTEDIELLPDRVMVLSKGEVRFDGTPAELASLGRASDAEDDQRDIESGLRVLGGLE